jgi:hypothetical protein
VNDRPGDWGRLYDEILEEVRTKKDLVVLDYHGLPEAAYAAANGVILNEAISLAKVRREDIDFRFFQGRLAGK